jgi:hypothetical protein
MKVRRKPAIDRYAARDRVDVRELTDSPGRSVTLPVGRVIFIIRR